MEIEWKQIFCYSFLKSLFLYGIHNRLQKFTLVLNNRSINIEDNIKHACTYYKSITQKLFLYTKTIWLMKLRKRQLWFVKELSFNTKRTHDTSPLLFLAASLFSPLLPFSNHLLLPPPTCMLPQPSCFCSTYFFSFYPPDCYQCSGLLPRYSDCFILSVVRTYFRTHRHSDHPRNPIPPRGPCCSINQLADPCL